MTIALVVLLGLQVTQQTPYDCKRHPIAEMCRGFETIAVQESAKLRKQIVPSTGVITIPGYGTDEAKRAGVACMSGQAFRKIRGGWEQLRDDQLRPQRCVSQ